MSNAAMVMGGEASLPRTGWKFIAGLGLFILDSSPVSFRLALRAVLKPEYGPGI
jgi:hypothetical protein